MTREEQLPFIICLVWMLVTVYEVSSLHPAPSFSVVSPSTATRSGKNDVVLNANEELILECKSPHGPVNWSHPEHSEFQPVDDDSSGYRIERKTVGREHSATLTVPMAQNYNTGLYTCRYEDDDPLFGSPSEVYVYVYDPDHYLVQTNEYNLIEVISGREVIIPCRPTAPNVTVILKNYYDEELKVDGTEVTFNPRIGFTVMNPPRAGNPSLHCHPRLGESEQEEVQYVLKLTKPPSKIHKPRIEGDVHAVENSSFNLLCAVDHENGDPIDIRWYDTSGKAVPIIDLDMISVEDITDRVYMSQPKPTYSSRNVASTTLTVRRASRTDNGTFRCVVDYGNNATEADHNMLILGKGQSFIELNPQSTRIDVKEGSDKDALVIVEIHAHPKPTVVWTAHNNVSVISGTGVLACDTVNDDLRYGSTTTDIKTKLTICNPKAYDTGEFVLSVTSPDGTSKSVSIFVNVEGGPTIRHFHEYDEYPLYGEDVVLNCTVSSNPRSHIRWLFRECDFRVTSNCDSFEPRVYKGIETNITDTAVDSVLHFTALKTGQMSCEACNQNGTSAKLSCREKKRRIIVSEMRDGFGIRYPENIVEGDQQVNVTCAASVYIFNDSLSWWKVHPIIEEAQKLSGIQTYIRTTDLSYKVDLVIDKAARGHSGVYSCIAKGKNGMQEVKNITVNVLPMIPPEIRESSFNHSAKISIAVGFSFQLLCRSVGRPTPTVLWYKDHRPISQMNDTRFRVDDNNTRLVVTRTIASDEGQYECRAVNRAGEAMRTIHIVLSSGISEFVYIGIATFGLLLIGVIVYLCIRIRRERIQRKRLIEAGLLDFEKGAVENLDPHLPVDEQAERLPYDPDFEFPRSKLKLGKVLGSGAFGVVLKGEAYGILQEDEVTAVAVKTVKRNADGAILRALTSELKILIHLGRHLNVVNLLGACTKSINKMELLVIVEYCRYGNLQNYLLRHRKVFVNQVDPNTGQIDYSIRGVHPADRRLKYATLSFHSSSHSNSMDLKDYRCQSDYGENLVSGATDVTTVSMTPTGTPEEPFLTSNSANQPEWRSNYRGDYKDNVEPITTEDLVCFAFQVARGMDYLASRKVLHGDLAARNILLADNRVVKICDFGLARTMYKDETYRKKENGLLPIKWMAIESLRDRIFSTQSDVWSFGIVLWEFFTLSRTPYPGTEPNQTFLQKLEEGYRMEKPPYSPDEVYEIMMACWRARPTLRPTFLELSEKLGSLLNEDVRMLYTEMNKPYIEKNNAWMEGPGRQDYLAMVNAPVYDNMTSPLPVDDDPRISSPLPRTPGSVGVAPVLQDGYVVMRSPSVPSDSMNIFSPTRSSGSNGGTVFKFNSPPRTLSSPDEEHVELRPMLRGGSFRSESTNESDTDAYLEPRNNRPVHPSNKFSFYPQESTVVDSVSNPSYLMAPTIKTSNDNYINYPQPIDSKGDAAFWRSRTDGQPKAILRPSDLNYARPVHFERDLDQDVKLPPSYINIPSQRRGFALPNNDDGTYANLR